MSTIAATLTRSVIPIYVVIINIMQITMNSSDHRQGVYGVFLMFYVLTTVVIVIVDGLLQLISYGEANSNEMVRSIIFNHNYRSNNPPCMVS